MKTVKILVVEDDKSYSKLLQTVFTAEGFTVIAAEDGSAALRCLASETVDLILSDIQMPNLDGYQFVHELKENVVYKCIPVVMFTASSTSSRDEFWAEELGAKAFIRKPAHYKEIIQKVKEVLEANRNIERKMDRLW
jgi:DNA-binding response OmpR family regulator